MEHTRQTLYRTIFVWAIAALLTAVLFSVSASALTSVPTRMNFQGKLTDGSGAALPNGTYNMRFRLFNASTAGTQQWSENRLVSATQGVTVTNGVFSVQLGEITSLPASVFNQTNLYFEVELPTPATATTSSPAWTEGAMSPRSQLATSAYAYTAETLDGLDSAAFAQVGANNTFSGTNTFGIANVQDSMTLGSNGNFILNAPGFALDNGSYTTLNSAENLVNGVNDANKFYIDNNLSSRLFTADTNSMQVTVGTATNGVIVSSTGFQLVGNARNTKTISLAPEYPGATFTGDGSTNLGSLSSDFCSSASLLNRNASACGSASDEHNYYAWTTTEASVQDYDVFIRYQIPSDYSSGSMTNLRLWGWGTTSASEIVRLDMYKGSSTPCATITNAVTANAAWNEAIVASPLGGCSIAAGEFVTFKIRVAAGQNRTARAGEISFTYRGTF